MDINPSGYYGWVKRKDKRNRYEKKRNILTILLWEAHRKHPSYGYRRLSHTIRAKNPLLFTDHLAHKCCQMAGIKSQAKHYRFKPLGKEHIHFPNRIHNHWNASRPMEIVVSDMTCLRHKGKTYEWTYMLDTYNNEIISSHLSSQKGDRKPYFNCLKDLLHKMKDQTFPLVLHTDQGAVYSSRAFAFAHKDYTIIRSMSRIATPTDNPIIESINGWIKAELHADFHYLEWDDIYASMEAFVHYFNHERPAYKLNYQSPVQYRIEQGFG